MPELPTIAESGVLGYQATSWLGLLAPAGVPSAITSRINADVIALLNNAELRERLAGDGAEPVGTSSREFETFLREEIAKWGKVIRAAGIVVH
jgi:tripartite-type tricarboxylate transporter receptor subunit TctC